ncbi:alpha/beta fold hydrolase [Saccharothrix australiensis]|uniref:Pimeloyl-ACP methyl ester carboxylesterase n=1 Tax=Saccharothrix australiensis TaxID=2072 RepID=A0A495W756_9PSEU|nr:alpha/beta fold hydrolase [Saccharothrix australiensis]RKT57309.1 pimeloyl-ACP methyl ester carboxylesterase [Saccharothrix australiensis]
MTTPIAERARAVAEHWTSVDGTSTRYLEAGRGHPVVLIPGEGGVAEQWYDVIGALSDHYRVIALDLPGFGYTEPIADVSAPAFAAFVWRFARTLGLARPVLVGHSLGGAIAVHAAVDRPGDVPALVLISAAGMGRAVNPALVLQSVTPLGDLTPLLVPLLPYSTRLFVLGTALVGSCRPWRISRRWWPSQAQAVATPGVLATTLRSQRVHVGLFGQRDPLLDRLRDLPMPTLVLWGIHDRQLPFWQGIAARRRLRRGRLRLVPLTSHLLPLEAPGAVVSAVRPFLDGVPAVDGDPSGGGEPS